MKLNLSYRLSWIGIVLLRLYQWAFSPMKYFIFGSSESCRFHPSCSNYAIGALRRYGFFRGSILAIKRLFRCHPWNPGGHDPVPEKETCCTHHQ
ncbi:MAG: membrane protein insertion efficiency factor YidD [Puniceicoccaceae bacterium]|nr:MAG: membrane protein insertion efficiency factor YidD [Puniceicoccaceae bacterium]